MRQNNETFADFNRLAREVMSYPDMRYSDVREAFAEITRLLEQAVDQLLRVTTFVEDNLGYYLAEIMTSSIKTKKSYRGRWDKRREGVGSGVEFGAENIRVLGACFDVYKLSRVQRAAAYLPLKRLVRAARLNNLVYEQIISSFVAATQRYCTTVDCLAREASRLPDDGSASVQQFQKISDLIDAKQLAENMVGCVVPNHLYGIVALVTRLHGRLQQKKAEIVKAHLKLILKTVRANTYHDNDALEAFQAGSMGLLHAVSAFDYRGRTAFPTFARQWVRQRVTVSRRSATGPLIRIPFAIWEQYSQIQTAERSLQYRYPDGIPDGAVAAQLSLSSDVIRQVQDFVRSSYVGSLDDEVRHADETVTSKIASIQDEQINEQLDLEEMRQELLQIVQHLTPEHRKILCLRFGFLEGIENQIDARERLREIYRQLAGKTIVASMQHDAEPAPVTLPDEPAER
jgi:RNA polymerase sigma factor (sigma-70 family)